MSTTTTTRHARRAGPPSRVYRMATTRNHDWHVQAWDARRGRFSGVGHGSKHWRDVANKQVSAGQAQWVASASH